MYRAAFAEPVMPTYPEPETEYRTKVIVDENNAVEAEVPSARLRYLDPDDVAPILSSTDIGARTARDY